jgi:regulatory protein
MSSECKYSFLEAKARLEALCAYQERCSFELNNKMIKWGIGEDDRNALLAHLIENNFLSEERFAEAFVSGKVNIKRWGRSKIRVELKARRISEYSLKKGIESIDEEVYWKNLLHLTEKKFNSTKESDAYKKKMKVFRFLATKGYETDLIKEAYDQIISQ